MCCRTVLPSGIEIPDVFLYSSLRISISDGFHPKRRGEKSGRPIIPCTLVVLLLYTDYTDSKPFTIKPWKKAKMSQAKYEGIISAVPQEYLDEIRLNVEA